MKSLNTWKIVLISGNSRSGAGHLIESVLTTSDEPFPMIGISLKSAMLKWSGKTSHSWEVPVMICQLPSKSLPQSKGIQKGDSILLLYFYVGA